VSFTPINALALVIPFYSAADGIFRSNLTVALFEFIQTQVALRCT